MWEDDTCRCLRDFVACLIELSCLWQIYDTVFHGFLDPLSNIHP